MTDTNAELPENRYYHLLKNGEYEPSGPYSPNQLFSMLHAGEIRSSDFIYFQEWDGWKRFSQVFNLEHEVCSNFGNEGQDHDILSDTFKFMNERGVADEILHYIAVQYLPALSITAAVRLTMPKSVILTNKRFCVLEPKLLGESVFEEFSIEQVEGGMKRIKEHSKNGSFNIILHSGDWVEVNKIPAAQLKQLVEISKQLVSGQSRISAIA